MAIDAAFLEGDPIGPQIALLDHVKTQQAGFGDADRRAMQRPTITKEDDVADPLVDHQPLEKLRPFVLAAAKIHRSRKAPERPISAVKINPVDGVAAVCKRSPETLEEACRHSLQKQKAAAGRRDLYQRPPERFADSVVLTATNARLPTEAPSRSGRVLRRSNPDLVNLGHVAG